MMQPIATECTAQVKSRCGMQSFAFGPLDICEGADLGQGCGGRGLSDCINVVTVSSYEFLGCHASGEPAICHASVVFLVVFSPMRDRMQILKTKTSKSSNSAASFESFADFGATIHAGL